MKQEHDFHYISKHDPKVEAAYDDLMQLLREVRKELKNDYTFQHRLVGSYARNMMTYDAKGNVGPDFDVNIYPNDDENKIKPKALKTKFKAALDKFGPAHGYDAAEDSTRVLTIKIKDRKHSRVIFSVDFCFVNDYQDEDGYDCQEYIHFNKKQKTYEWQKQSDGYYMLPDKIQWIKDNGIWQRVLDRYIDNKSANTDPHVHSRTIFANTVHQVCQQAGYYDEDDDDDYYEDDDD